MIELLITGAAILGWVDMVGGAILTKAGKHAARTMGKTIKPIELQQKP